MNYKTYTIGEVAELIQTGKTPRSTVDEYFNGNINWYTPGDFGEKLLNESKRTITERAIKENAGSMFPQNSVLITCIGNIGHVGIISKPSSSNQQITAIKPNEKLLTPEYLYYWTIKHKKLLEHVSNSAVVPILNNKSLRNIKIKLPPLETQKQIVEILDQADKLRKKREKSIEKIEKFGFSVFTSMFGNISNPKVSKIPLGNLIKSGPQNGIYKPASEYGSGTQIIRIDGYDNGDVISDMNSFKLLNLTSTEKQKYLVSNNDILINRVNSPSHLGKSAIIMNLSTPAVFESNMMKFSVDENQVLPRFAAFNLSLPYLKRQILNMARDAVNQSSINQQDVQSLEICVPNILLQKRFIEIIESSDSLERKFFTQSENLSSNLFKSLLKSAFSGGFNG